MIKENVALTKKQKIAESENYWAQFGDGDIFGLAVKKKSKLEMDKERASKARLKAKEKELKSKIHNDKEKEVLLI